MRVLILGNNDMGLYKFRRELLEELVYRNHEVYVSVPDGDYIQRIKDIGCKVILTEFNRRGMNPVAVISRRVEIGKGTVVMAGAVINSDTTIGEGCIINTCSSVDHDNRLGDFVHIAVGTHLCGTVEVGSRTWVGAGATVSNNISICDDCVIGAGAVVVKDIKEKGTYIGVPARKKKLNTK